MICKGIKENGTYSDQKQNIFTFRLKNTILLHKGPFKYYVIKRAAARGRQG